MEQITQSSHLEKLCLIKEGVGKDSISDFTTNLIKGYICEYTQEFSKKNIDNSRCKKVSVKHANFDYNTRRWNAKTYTLPYIDGDFVLLTPKDILTKDDAWINKHDIIGDFDEIAESIPNIELRAQINEYFLRQIPDRANQREINEAISRTLRKFPALIDYYIRYKEDHKDDAVALSEQKIKETEVVFIRQVTNLVETLRDQKSFYSQKGDTELRGLVAREIDEDKVIIPIWLNIKRSDVIKFSPPLADKIAIIVEGNMNIDEIAIQVIRVIRPDIYKSHSREEQWLKTSLLYWDELRTIVPESIDDPYKSNSTQALADAGLLRPVRVHSDMEEIEDLTDSVLTYLSTNEGARVVAMNGHRGSVIHEEKLPYKFEQFADIHPEKLPYKVRNELRHLFRDSNRDGSWLTVDSGFADFYMTLLATKLSERTGASLVTADSMAKILQ